jgi:methyltransferase (TIGR00027 family)
MEGIAKTAFYCCGVRAADARRAKPLCGDTLAQRFMTAEAEAIFARFAGRKGARIVNATRHRVIDDQLRTLLRDALDLRVVLLGAGFDTRAFRLKGGGWVEIDQPDIIAVKEAELPASASPNPLQRVAMDFSTDSLAAKLAPWRGEPAAVVMEGVSMYLRQTELQQTLATLVATFPGHRLICDLMTATFVRRRCDWLRRWLEESGKNLGDAQDDPATPVIAAGYHEVMRVSLADRARDLGAPWVPSLIYNLLPRDIRDGYNVHVFKART